MSIAPFTPEQRQVLADLEQEYGAWLAAERALAALPYGLKWKRIGGREYLYEIADRRGNGRSLGRRSEATEARVARYHGDKAAGVEARDRAAERLDETCRRYRALRLPLVSAEAGRILREADRRGILDGQLVVVSETAVAALDAESGGRLAAGREDLHHLELACALTAGPHLAGEVQSLLKALGWVPAGARSPALTARNGSGYEVTLFGPAPASGRPRGGWPPGLETQDRAWLTGGTPVSRVLVARDGAAVRVVTLDPRRFALLKLWQADRLPAGLRERAADLRLAALLLDAFPPGPGFADGLPRVFAALFARWNEGALAPAEEPAAAAGAADPQEPARSRLSYGDRQNSIVEAAVAVFAEQGFAAATTQQIAAAAKVSSALLYRHFPSKRALYRAVLRKLVRDQNASHEKIHGPEASTAGLLAMLQGFFSQAVGLLPDPRDMSARRVLFASLAGDGSYAQLVFRRALRLRVHTLERALAAGRASGDISGSPLHAANLFFMIDHIGETIGIAYGAGRPVIPYGGSRETLVHDAVRFCARGMGIADGVIDAFLAAQRPGP